MADFHFIRPLYLLLIPAGLFLSYLIWTRASSISRWAEICDAHLIKHLLVGKQLKNSGVPYFGMVLAWIITAIAIAGPTWERLPQPAHSILEGRVLVFDLSLSMNSTDVQPSRLLRARYKLADLIMAGENLQQGLVVFAGDAFVVAPLTDDTNTLINLTPSLNTNTLPVQGSRADLGLELAITLISNTGLSKGDIILITDGVSRQTVDIAEKSASMGYRVSVLAVGTDGGGPVQLGNGELLKDSAGNIVIPAVDHKKLREVALAGAGRYVEMAPGNVDIDRLMGADQEGLSLAYDQQLEVDSEQEQFTSDQWKDNGPWLVLPLLLILSLGFRRGWVLSIAFLILPLTPEHAYAFSWGDLWLRADQQAARNFNLENYGQIPDNAPVEWQGALKYRGGDFDGAIDAYSIKDAENSVAHYNRGNALVQSRALRDALTAYDRALDIDPDMQDAIFNRALVEDILKQQDEQSQASGENNDQSEQRKDQNANNRESEQKGGQQGQQDSKLGDIQKKPEGSSSSDGESGEDQNYKPDVSEMDETDQESQSRQSKTVKNSEEQQQVQDRNPDSPMSEQQQAMEQWLQRIPDDPGGLLRRKFSYQYSQRQQQTHSEQW